MLGPCSPVRRVVRGAVPVLLASFLAACGAAPLRVASMDEVERARSTDMARESARSAPEAYARAEHERDLARQAHASGDDVSANLHAEHALAGYQHAAVVARLFHAAAEQSDAQKLLDDATAQLASVNAERAKLEREADDLDQRARLLRERLFPAASAPTTAEREAARRTAARSLAAEARLLCGAARLIKSDAEGLASATDDVSAVEARLERAPPKCATGTAAHPTPTPATAATPSLSPIDDAARARARCLELLTVARRANGDDANQADRLLAELSASGGWDPVRDERGVAIALQSAYRGPALVENSTTKLQELGRIAAAHPSFAIQVVVHDGVAPEHAETNDVDHERSEAAVQALVAGGANRSRIQAEIAGTRIPVADPSDSQQRQRNERLEVVFVGP